ncbi:MAG: hypothetical protein DRO00_09330, partial [Thermoproteota archaeon]
MGWSREVREPEGEERNRLEKRTEVREEDIERVEVEARKFIEEKGLEKVEIEEPRTESVETFEREFGKVMENGLNRTKESYKELSLQLEFNDEKEIDVSNEEETMDESVELKRLETDREKTKKLESISHEIEEDNLDGIADSPEEIRRSNPFEEDIEKIEKSANKFLKEEGLEEDRKSEVQRFKIDEKEHAGAKENGLENVKEYNEALSTEFRKQNESTKINSP